MIFPPEANAYLDAHPRVKPIFLASLRPLVSAFGYEPEIDLRIITDPEDGTRDALAVVKFTSSVEEAYAALDRFNENWWYDNMHLADYKLSFMLDPAESNG